ncbi:MAG TPA: nitrilase-related carbon-nitrogen hydrolase [Rhizomicrobium sp.]|nr:nitrilase-related carbon-nitrogen hydrolase [Rhizomicrobium sp.]
MIAILCALLSGALFYVSQGPADLWYLAWLAPAPILWLAYGDISNRRLVYASLAAFLIGQCYVFLYTGVFAALPPLVTIPILISTFLLQTIAFPLGVGFARYVRRRAAPIVTLFAFPACWTAFEYAIGLVSPHGSFGALAYTQMSAPVVIQSASLFGLYGVTFLICLFANALAMALRGWKGSWIAAALGAAICAANVAFGFARLAEPQPDTIRVAALSDMKAMVATYRADTLASAVALSERYAREATAAAAKGARLVVIPEGGVIVKRAWRTEVFAPLLAASRQTGTQIVAGAWELAPPGDLAFTFNPDGSMESYAKRHPMPLLESQFTAGTASGVIGNARAVAICKDMDFPRTIRDDAASGVRLMAVPAGDLIYDAWIHGRLALMRGVENGFAVVHAAHQGLLTASDSRGRLIAAKMAWPKAGMSTIVADLPLGPGTTLYTRIGDVFEWLCVALSLAIFALARLYPASART